MLLTQRRCFDWHVVFVFTQREIGCEVFVVCFFLSFSIISGGGLLLAFYGNSFPGLTDSTCFFSSPSRPFKKCSMMRVVQLLPPLESARLTFSKIEARKHIMPFKKYISYFFFFCFDPNNIIKRSRHFCGQPIIQIWHVRKLFKKLKINKTCL